MRQVVPLDLGQERGVAEAVEDAEADAVREDEGVEEDEGVDDVAYTGFDVEDEDEARLEAVVAIELDTAAGEVGAIELDTPVADEVKEAR